jgi:septum formation protein
MGKDFIYLASASPRRGELLRQIGVDFVVRPARIAERRRDEEPAGDYVQRIAQAKAASIWARVAAESAPRPVLAADTAVVVNGQVLGKPESRDDALRMLLQLSGRSHEVVTAVALLYEQEVQMRVNSSKVRFRATTERERAAYCATREPIDKAGGYGIQGMAAVFVEEINGSYSAVMGLPLCETASMLLRYGIPGWLHGEQAS